MCSNNKFFKFQKVFLSYSIILYESHFLHFDSMQKSFDFIFVKLQYIFFIMGVVYINVTQFWPPLVTLFSSRLCEPSSQNYWPPKHYDVI